MPSPVFNLLGGLGAGLCGGLLSGLFGIGGGIVLIPLLGLLLRLDQHHAQGVSLAAMLLPNGLPAVLQYIRRGVGMQWRLLAGMFPAFLAGAWVGALGANRVPGRELRWIFIAFLFVVAVRTYRKAQGAPLKAATPPLTRGEALVPGLGIGLVGGLASGLLGIGGGIIMIPLMVAWVKLTQHEAQLASLAVMLPPVGLPAVWVYARTQGGFPWAVLIGVAAGFALGAFLGARVATRLQGQRLQTGFAGLIVAMGLLLLLR